MLLRNFCKLEYDKTICMKSRIPDFFETILISLLKFSMHFH